MCRVAPIFFSTFLAVLLLFTCLTRNVLAETSDIVVEIEIKGLLTITEDVVKTKLETQVGKQFAAKALKNDIQRLHLLGFFSNIEVQVTQSLKGVKVTFLVNENQLLGEIKFFGNSAIATDELLKDLRLAKEKYLAPYTLSLDLLHIKEAYRKKGYLFVDVKTETKPVSGWVDLHFIVDEGPPVILYEINFFGHRSFSKRTLLGFTQSQESSLFSSTYYDEDVFQEDLILVRNFYRSEGFLDVKVQLRDLSFTNDRTGVILNVSVEEGPLYSVKNIRIEGNKLFTEKELRQRMELTTDSPFRQGEMAKDKNRIERIYGENGFLNIKITPVVSFPNISDPAVNIAYKIEEGDTTYIRKLDVEGNQLTRDDVLRREFLIGPGELFNLGKIEDTQQRLRRLQYFDTIKLDLNDTEEETWKDINIKVEEGRTGSLRFAAGLTSDLGAVGEITLTKRNFDISKLPTSFESLISGDSLTGAGQTLDIFLQAGKELFRFKISFVEPYFLGQNLLFAPEIYLTDRVRESWSERHLGMQPAFGGKLGLDTTIRLTYRLEDVKVEDVSTNAPRDVFAVRGNNTLSTLSLDYTIDTRDDFILPTRGYTVGLAYEVAGVFLGGDHNFSKLNVRLAWFQTVYNTQDGYKHVLSLGARLGLADAHGQSRSVPIFERFFAGGSTSVRGFRFRTIGPKENDDPIGGECMLLGTVEYGLPLYKDVVRMVVFADIGNVVPVVDYKIFQDVRIAIGFGFRLKIPLLGPTPFAFDFGFPITKESSDETQVFSFSLGKPF